MHTYTKLLTHIHVDDFGRKNTKMFTVAHWMVGMKALLILSFTYFTIFYKKKMSLLQSVETLLEILHPKVTVD